MLLVRMGGSLREKRETWRGGELEQVDICESNRRYVDTEIEKI